MCIPRGLMLEHACATTIETVQTLVKTTQVSAIIWGYDSSSRREEWQPLLEWLVTEGWDTRKFILYVSKLPLEDRPLLEAIGACWLRTSIEVQERLREWHEVPEQRLAG